jgi:hypothetical protein
MQIYLDEALVVCFVVYSKNIVLRPFQQACEIGRWWKVRRGRNASAINISGVTE